MRCIPLRTRIQAQWLTPRRADVVQWCSFYCRRVVEVSCLVEVSVAVRCPPLPARNKIDICNNTPRRRKRVFGIRQEIQSLFASGVEGKRRGQKVPTALRMRSIAQRAASQQKASLSVAVSRTGLTATRVPHASTCHKPTAKNQGRSTQLIRPGIDNKNNNNNNRKVII